MDRLEMQITFFLIFFISLIVLICLRNRGKLLTKDIGYFASIIFISFLITSVKHFILTNFLNAEYPLSTFLFDPSDRFNDFFNMLKVCSSNNPYGIGQISGSSYFPVANSIMFILGLTGYPYVSLGIVYIIFITVLGFYIKKMFGKKLTMELLPSFIIITLTTYPFLFNLDRGNIDMVVFMFVVGFFYYSEREKTFISLLFLALSISMKLYPAVFMILLLKDKKYKEIAIVIVLSAIFTLGSLLSFSGTLSENIKALLRNLGEFNQNFNTFYGLQHNLSLYGVIRVITFIMMTLIDGQVTHGVFTNAIPWYTLGVLILFAGICIYILFFEPTKWKNVTILTIVMLLFPNVSFDYRLIFFFIPLMYFIKEETGSKHRNLYLLLFSLLFIPHNYLYLYWDISTGVLIYPAIMVMILGMIFYERIRYPSSGLKDLKS